MIYKLLFEDRTEWYQAKNILHLLQSYERECDGFRDIKDVIEISDEEAKIIMIKNNDESTAKESPVFSLYDVSVGDEFQVLASTEW